MIQPLNLPEPKARCSAMHPERGTQCGLPESHIGQHQNGTICGAWPSDAFTVDLRAIPINVDGSWTSYRIEGKERFDKMHAELTQKNIRGTRAAGGGYNRTDFTEPKRRSTIKIQQGRTRWQI